MTRRLVIAVVAIAAIGAAAVASAASLGVTGARLTAFQVAGISGPRMAGITMHDDDTDGFIDRVVVTFDAGVTTTNVSDWTLANVPSGGTLQSATPSGNDVVLLLAGATGAADTAAGNFTVELNDTTDGLVSFGPTAPVDRAGPVPVAVTTTDAGTVGQMEAGDTLAVTFSEDLAPASVPTSVPVAQQDDASTGVDFLDIAGITNGAVNLGGADYLRARNKVAAFASSTAALTSTTQVRVTVAGACTADCNQLRPGQGSFTYIPAPTLTDGAGNAAAGSLTTAPTFRLF